MKKNPVHYIIIGISILLLLTTLLIDGRAVIEHTPKPVSGILDLRDWSFKEDGIVDLSGDWTFYPNQLLTPVDLENSQDLQSMALPIPLTAGNFKHLNGLNRELYGTMKLRILLPEKTDLLGIKSNLMLSANRLFIEDQTFSVGVVGSSKDATVPKVRVNEYYFSPKNNELDLIYQVSDFYMGDTTIIAPKLGLASDIAYEAKMAMARDLFLFGMLFIIGIYHLGLFGMRTKDRSALYFALFCICFALRMGLVGERFALLLIEVNLIWILRACYVFLCVGIMGMFGFLYVTFSEVFKPWFMRVVWGTSGLMIVCILTLEYINYQYLFNIYLGVVFPLIAYSLFRLFVAVRRKIEYASLVLVGIVCISATAINDLIFQITLSTRASMIPVGMFIFIMTQAFTLSSKFSKTFAMAENLSLENEKMLFEIREVNRSLEVRVKERTADLQIAMENLEHMSKTDYLTGLPNRRCAFERLEKRTHEGKSFFIALADLDNFKKFNDTYGHDVGDQVLKSVSNLLVEGLSDYGFVGRWGGEEFILAIDEAENQVALERVNHLRESVKNLALEGVHEEIGSGQTISITLGMCQFTGELTLDQCIKFADEALYEGKSNGRNCTISYEIAQ